MRKAACKYGWRLVTAVGWTAALAPAVAYFTPVSAEDNSIEIASQRDDSPIQNKTRIIDALHQEGLISDKEFQRESHELELSVTLFTNKCPPRAYVPRKIYFSFRKSDEGKVRDLIQGYALQGRIDLPSTAERGFGTIQVDEGHEWFWVDALQSSGLFDSIDRHGYSCPELVDATVGLSHPRTTLASPAITVGATGPDPLEAALDHIRASFPNPAQVNLLQSSPNLLKLEVIGFRDRVLLGKAVLGAAGNLPCPVAALFPRFAVADKGDRRWIFCHGRGRQSSRALGLSKHGATVLRRFGKVYWGVLHKLLIMATAAPETSGR